MSLFHGSLEVVLCEPTICLDTNAIQQTQTAIIVSVRVSLSRCTPEKAQGLARIPINPQPVSQAKTVTPSRFRVPLKRRPTQKFRTSRRILGDPYAFLQTLAKQSFTIRIAVVR
jgi:hypothetical protein